MLTHTKNVQQKNKNVVRMHMATMNFYLARDTLELHFYRFVEKNKPKNSIENGKFDTTKSIYSGSCQWKLHSLLYRRNVKQTSDNFCAHLLAGRHSTHALLVRTWQNLRWTSFLCFYWFFNWLIESNISEKKCFRWRSFQVTEWALASTQNNDNWSDSCTVFGTLLIIFYSLLFTHFNGILTILLAIHLKWAQQCWFKRNHSYEI